MRAHCKVWTGSAKVSTNCMEYLSLAKSIFAFVRSGGEQHRLAHICFLQRVCYSVCRTGRQRRRWWCWFGVETFPTHAATQTQAHLHCSTFMVTGFPGVWRGEALPTLSKCLKVYTLPTGACGFVALPANPGPSCTFL